MRSRNIKPGFFKNEKLASLPLEARVLFIGLWCIADRAGRLEERPQRIKAEIFPYEHDTSTVLAWCKMLAENKFIIRYERKGNQYIQIINFDKHQYPHVREQPSTIPAPGRHSASTSPARLNPSSLIPESITLNPEALGYDFESVWKDYPRKIGKEEARKHFDAQVKTLKDFEDLKIALIQFLNELKKNQTEEKFIPHGSTWFNNKWRDYANEATHGTNGSAGTVSYRDKLRRQKETEGLREGVTVGTVSSGGGNMPDV